MKKEKLLKISAYASGAITILMGLIYIFINFIFPWSFNIYRSKAEEEAVGIIGGTDGPTVIFIANKASAGISLGGLIIIFALITTILFLLNRYKKTKDL